MVERDEDNVPLAFGLTLIAGLCTTIGASSAFFSKLRDYGLLTRGLATSAGVMLYVSFCEILQVKAVESFTDAIGERSATAAAYACFFGGILLTVLLDKLVHRIGKHHHSHDPDDVHKMHESGAPVPPRGLQDSASEPEVQMGELDEEDVSAREDKEEKVADDDGDTDLEAGGVRRTSAAGDNGMASTANLTPVLAAAATTQPSSSASDLTAAAAAAAAKEGAGEDEHPRTKEEREELSRMGLMTALAIAIHNLPEGLATFVATLDDPSVGVAIAFAIGIHNIPEGACVAMPVYYATGSRWKAFWWAFFSGVTEPVGAVIGYFLLRAVFTDALFGVLFGLVSGMMAFIAFKELLPTARKYDPGDKLVTWYIVLGMFIMALSLVLFSL